MYNFLKYKIQDNNIICDDIIRLPIYRQTFIMYNFYVAY